MLLVAVYMPLFLTVYAYSPNTPVEMIFLCGGLLALTSYERAKAQPESPAAKRRMGRMFVVFGALVIAATLNRETAILLPIAFASVTRDGRRSLLLFALWGATYGAVRMAQGWDAPVILTLGQTWQRNTSEYLDLTIIHNGLLLPLLALAAWKARRAPQFLRRAAVIIPLYAVMFIVGALWHEVRLWLPVLAVALPIMLREETIGGANDS